MKKYLVVLPEKRDDETKKIVLPRVECCIDANGICEAYSMAASRYPDRDNISIYPWPGEK